MRRVAANRVYTDRQTYFKNHVVELFDDCVTNHFSLNGEIEMTEWLGGIIILSRSYSESVFEAKSLDECFEILENSDNVRKRYYAYHISGIDIQNEIFIAGRRITLVEENID
jgi:hypothetical protein